MKRFLSLVFAVCLVFSLCACAQQTNEPAVTETANTEPAVTEQPDGSDEPVSSLSTISLCTGRQGAGILYPFTVAYAEFLMDDGVITDYSIIPSGTAASPVLVDSNECQLGWCTTDVSWLAKQGIGMFDTATPNFSLMACTYGGGLCIVTFADNTEINSTADLAGKRVNVGSAGQVQYVIADYLLRAAGLSFDDLAEANNLALADACEEMKNGNLDALIVYNSLPLSTIMELNTYKQIRLVPLGDDVIDNMCEELPVLQKISYPAESTYDGITEDFDTITNFGCIVVSNSIDEDTVYLMTKSYIEHYSELQETVGALKDTNGEQICMETNGLEYHPGAVKYYKELGWM